MNICDGEKWKIDEPGLQSVWCDGFQRMRVVIDG